MILQTQSFKYSYEGYYQAINKYLKDGISVLEVGGGAFPSILNREDLDYCIVDPDSEELQKAPNGIIKINSSVEEISDKKFDLIISKMVLEHVKNPNEFHTSILNLLKNDGVVIHFFACRHSIPAFVNRILPERAGEFILKVLKNRDTSLEPKYFAYYNKTIGHTNKQIDYFQNLGYSIIEYRSFVGHNYFNNILVLNYIEKLATKLLTLMKLKSFSTVALVELELNNKET